MSNLSNPDPPVHPHGIHCLHRHGWRVQRWCPQCHFEWADTCGRVNDNRFEARCNAGLAYQVLVELESGDLPMPPAFDALERRFMATLEASPN